MYESSITIPYKSVSIVFVPDLVRWVNINVQVSDSRGTQTWLLFDYVLQDAAAPLAQLAQHYVRWLDLSERTGPAGKLKNALHKYYKNVT